MKRVMIFFNILTWISLVSAQSPSGQPVLSTSTRDTTQRVIAKGVGAIIGGDVVKAEEDAIANALKNAVEQTVGVMIESDVLVKNYQVLESSIFTHTRGYIQSYRILAKNEMGQNILEVTIEAIVKTGHLRDDLKALGILFLRKNYPRLMVIIDETNVDTHLPLVGVNLNVTESEIITTLQAKGFQFVEKSVVAQKVQQESLVALLEGDSAAARLIASSIGAEVLIIGKAVSAAAQNVPPVLKQTGMTSVHATVNLQAIRGDDGRVIASVMRDATAAHVNPLAGGAQALKKAAHLAALALAEQIAEVWRQDVYSTTTVQVRVLNIPSYGEVTHIKNWLLSYIRGIQKVIPREYNGGTALFEVQTTLDSPKIAEEIVAKKENVESNFYLEILSVHANSLVVKYVRKKRMPHQNK